MDSEESFAGRNDIANKVNNGGLLLCDQTTLRGKIWRIFSRITNREGVPQDFVCCKNCRKIYKFNNSHTSNLCRHSCYVEKFSNTENEISIVEEEKPKIHATEVTVNNLTQLLTKWIIQNCRSFDLIEAESLKEVFQELLKLGAKWGSNLDVSSFLPRLSDVTENIFNVHNRLFEFIKMEIASVKASIGNSFGLTTDTWRDNLSNESYIAVTIHYVKDGTLTYRLLGLQTLETDSITDQSICESVNSILEKFDCHLSNKCILVTDEVSSSTQTFQSCQHLVCISQLLNSALLKSIEKVPKASEIINDCTKLVNFLNKNGPNTLLRKLLYKHQHNRCLVIHQMLNSILINWKEIQQVLKNVNETQNFTVNKDEIKAIETVFQPFADAIETLEDNSSSTLHLVMAYMNALTKFCRTTIDEYNHFDFVANLQEHIYLNLEENVRKNITTLHKLAVFLYPPTNKLLPYSDEEKKSIEDECLVLMKAYKNETQQEPADSTSPSICKRRKLFADFLESEQNYKSVDAIREEIQNYKNTRVVFSPNFDDFNWWQLQKDNFPLLYKLSSTVMATPATSAASKQAICNAKILINEKYREHDDYALNIEEVVFISNNRQGVVLDKYLTA